MEEVSGEYKEYLFPEMSGLEEFPHQVCKALSATTIRLILSN